MDEFRWVHVKTKDEAKHFFKSLLPKIREAGFECGYAIGVHGSMRRDFDLIAVPWVPNYADKEVLVRKIHKAACGLESQSYAWEQMPHGRVATAFPICWPEWAEDGSELSAGHIDLSVVEFEKSLRTHIHEGKE